MNSWGAAPGYDECAPLVLADHASAMRPGEVQIDSLNTRNNAKEISSGF